ncbi:MAG TPA: hypothetical protein DCE33_10620 [Rhodospirillaceae bacterium]|nr:hypothetical protein [Rhodospirillaceae bacterium]|tara:strand:- start:370 stop:639 length:270 start_codon:yes stop_codon:yes gene_type:complete
MSPALEDGDYAVVRRLHAHKPLSVGDIVSFDHPDFGSAVKRIKKLRGEMVMLEGLAKRSVESDQIGWVPKAHVNGRLVWRIAPSRLSRI